MISTIIIENPINFRFGMDSWAQISQKRSLRHATGVYVHFKCYIYEPWDVEYDLLGYCDLCNFRIDGFGYCAYGCSAD